jgi:hypothetical protein
MLPPNQSAPPFHVGGFNRSIPDFRFLNIANNGWWPPDAVLSDGKEEGKGVKEVEEGFMRWYISRVALTVLDDAVDTADLDCNRTQYNFFDKKHTVALELTYQNPPRG